MQIQCILNESLDVSNIEIVSILYFFVDRYRIEVDSDIDSQHLYRVLVLLVLLVLLCVAIYTAAVVIAAACCCCSSS